MPSDRVLEIAFTLMEEEDVDEALKMLLSNYPNPYDQAAAVENYVSQVKAFIIRQDHLYKNPEFEEQVFQLMVHATKEDRQRLMDLADAPLRVQYRTCLMKKRYLHDFRLDRQLKHLKPVKPIIYEFQISDDLATMAQEQRQRRIEDAQHHNRHSEDFYNKSEEEAEMFVVRALDTIKTPINKQSDLYRTIAALGLLCGRRNMEIAETLVWQPASHPYQAVVAGISKREGVYTGLEDEFTIPLLCSYTEFADAMTRVREFLANSNKKFNQSSIYIQSVKVFGEKLNHTQKRNLYSELAWRKRDTQNQFLVGNQACSKAVWIQQALCHNFSCSDTQRYTVMNIH